MNRGQKRKQQRLQRRRTIYAAAALTAVLLPTATAAAAGEDGAIPMRVSKGHKSNAFCDELIKAAQQQGTLPQGPYSASAPNAGATSETPATAEEGEGKRKAKSAAKRERKAYKRLCRKLIRERIRSTVATPELTSGASNGAQGNENAASSEAAQESVAQPATPVEAENTQSDESAESSSSAGETAAVPTDQAESVTPTTTPPTTQAPAVVAKKVLGDAVNAGDFGPLQVEITIEGEKVTSVKAVEYSKNGMDAQINANAIPKLEQSALAAQSADGVANVSGATYTSDAFKNSFASALAKS